MLFQRQTDDVYYDALLRRDAALDGHVYVCVSSTGIFCRLTCPARKPKRENCTFRETIAECIEAGFRPCKRCRPMFKNSGGDPVVETLLGALEKQPGRRFREADVEAMGFDRSTVRRAFKRQFGMSFLEIARKRRLSIAAEEIARGGAVIGAQVEAGFGSGSGFRSAIAQLFGEAPRALRGKALLKADWIETPIGPMLAICCEHALHLLEFADRPALPNEIRRLEKANGGTIVLGRTAMTERVRQELGHYFDGDAVGFSVPLGGHGTPFERLVWRHLRDITPGASLSYSTLAARMGRPSATRAVARANGANQIAIIIPCHRVLGVDGGLTGYGGGLWRKRWLLEHERRMGAADTAQGDPEQARYSA